LDNNNNNIIIIKIIQGLFTQSIRPNGHSAKVNGNSALDIRPDLGISAQAKFPCAERLWACGISVWLFGPSRIPRHFGLSTSTIGYLNNIYHWISARQNSHGKSANRNAMKIWPGRILTEILVCFFGLGRID
jgi:hypothetical protein